MKDLRKFIATTIREYLNEQEISTKKFIAYHGTSNDFKEFDIKKMHDKEGKSLNLGWGKGVINFTDSFNNARGYAINGNGDNPRVIKAELSFTNPFYMGSYMKGDTGYARYQRVRDGFVDTIDKNIWWGEIKSGKNLRMEAFIKQLKKEGYDGIVSGDDSKEYVIFYVNQIKILESIDIEK